MNRLAALALVAAAALAALPACTTLPTQSVTRYEFPKDAYVGEVKRPYEKLGLVKSRVDFQSFHPDFDEATLCRNYFNKAASDLLKRARDAGGDAVIDVRSVVFLIDGRTETYPRAECADEGGDGQVLAEGIAVKWKPEPEASGEAE